MSPEERDRASFEVLTFSIDKEGFSGSLLEASWINGFGLISAAILGSLSKSS
jgi:hypothetical protein